MKTQKCLTALGLEPYLPSLRFLLASLGSDGFLDPSLSV